MGYVGYKRGTTKGGMMITSWGIYGEIRDRATNLVESAIVADTPAEVFAWYQEHGVSMDDVEKNNFGFTYTRLT